METSTVKETTFKCAHFNKLFSEGGIHRLNEHLAGVKGNSIYCNKIPEEVCYEVQQHMDSKKR